jgi:hypothetical protein
VHRSRLAADDQKMAAAINEQLKEFKMVFVQTAEHEDGL